MALFERGHPRCGGRKEGTPNKATLIGLLEARCPGFHPIVAMWEMYTDRATPPEVRARLLDSIASYTVPRLKSIDLTELMRINDEALIGQANNGHSIDGFIQAFLGGKLSASDLATLVAALNLKRQAEPAVDEQAELLRLIKR